MIQKHIQHKKSIGPLVRVIDSMPYNKYSNESVSNRTRFGYWVSFCLEEEVLAQISADYTGNPPEAISSSDR